MFGNYVEYGIIDAECTIGIVYEVVINQAVEVNRFLQRYGDSAMALQSPRRKGKSSYVQRGHKGASSVCCRTSYPYLRYHMPTSMSL